MGGCGRSGDQHRRAANNSSDSVAGKRASRGQRPTRPSSRCRPASAARIGIKQSKEFHALSSKNKRPQSACLVRSSLSHKARTQLDLSLSLADGDLRQSSKQDHGHALPRAAHHALCGAERAMDANDSLVVRAAFWGLARARLLAPAAPAGTREASATKSQVSCGWGTTGASPTGCTT